MRIKAAESRIDAISSIRKCDVARNLLRNTIPSRPVVVAQKRNVLSYTKVKPRAQRLSTYHVMSRVNDRHHLLVIRVQNFTRTCWCRTDIWHQRRLCPFAI